MNVLPLRIVKGEPAALLPGHPGVTSWKDDSGVDVAYIATIGCWHWIEVRDVGSYRFPIDSPTNGVGVEVFPSRGAKREWLIDQYFRGVLPYVWHAYGMEALHASAFALEGRTIAMCAERRTGKSTLSYAMAKRGAKAVADDSVLLDFNAPTAAGGAREGMILVRPAPFEFRLRRSSAEHFAAPDKTQVLVSDDRTDEFDGQPRRLDAVVLLARRESGIYVEDVAPKEAFTALLEHALVFSLGEKDRKNTTVANYLRLARAVPVIRLSFPSGLEFLEEICGRLEQLVLELPSSAQFEAMLPKD